MKHKSMIEWWECLWISRRETYSKCEKNVKGKCAQGWTGFMGLLQIEVFKLSIFVRIARCPLPVSLFICLSLFLYKSMSWSTSRRERASEGRLVSELPLLLREWPPRTCRKEEKRKSEGEREERRWETRSVRKNEDEKMMLTEGEWGMRGEKRKEEREKAKTRWIAGKRKHKMLNDNRAASK